MFKKLLINPGVLASAVMAISVMAYPHAGSAEVLSITLNKTKIVRISRPASVIMIGDPTIADIQVDSSKVLFILGQEVGETNLIILDNNRNQIASYDLVVVPQNNRQVTINRSVGNVTTMSCNPRCTTVINPDAITGNVGSQSTAAGDVSSTESTADQSTTSSTSK